MIRYNAIKNNLQKKAFAIKHDIVAQFSIPVRVETCFESHFLTVSVIIEGDIEPDCVLYLASIPECNGLQIVHDMGVI